MSESCSFAWPCLRDRCSGPTSASSGNHGTSRSACCWPVSWKKRMRPVINVPSQPPACSSSTWVMTGFNLPHEVRRPSHYRHPHSSFRSSPLFWLVPQMAAVYIRTPRYFLKALSLKAHQAHQLLEPPLLLPRSATWSCLLATCPVLRSGRYGGGPKQNANSPTIINLQTDA